MEISERDVQVCPQPIPSVQSAWRKRHLIKTARKPRATSKQTSEGVPSRPEMDDDRARGFPARLAAHQAAEVGQSERDHRHQIDDTRPCVLASLLYQRPHSA